MKQTFTKQHLLSIAFLFFLGQFSFAQTFYTEDFDGGISDWTAEEVVGNNNASSNWIHTIIGPTGNFAVDPLNSTSLANGWMMFDSDLNCSGEQDVWLKSPVIDASTQTEVWLTFDNFYRQFNNDAFLEISTDGSEWTEIEIFTEAGNTDYGEEVNDEPVNPQRVIMDISQYAAGQSTLYFAFRFLADSTTVNAGTDIGCGYAWQIDDVALHSSDPTPLHNMVINRYFVAPSYRTPLSQADSIFFGAEVINEGLQDQDNVTLSVDVSTGGNSVYSDAFNIGTVPVGATDSIWYEGLYIPTDTGTYTITYTLTADSADLRPANNVFDTDFEITENQWSKEDGTQIGGIFADGVNRQGVLFDNFNDGDFATSIQFAMTGINGDSLVGKTVTIRLQETDFGGDPYDDDIPETVGQSSYTFTSADDQNDPRFISVPLLNTETACVGVDLAPNKVYTASVEYPSTITVYNSLAHLYQLQGEQAVLLRETDGSYFGGWISGWVPLVRMEITDSPMEDLLPISGFTAQTPDELTVTFEDASTFACDYMWDFGDGSSSFSLNPVHTYDAAGVYNVCQTITNDYGEDTTCEEITVGTVGTVDLADFNTIELAPNPVKDQLTLNVVMHEVAESTNIKILDLTGKVLTNNDYNQVSEQQFIFDLSQYAAGSYILQMTTEAGTTAQKFVIQK